MSQVARSVPYDDSVQSPQFSVSDVQSAIDYLKTTNGSNASPYGISTSTATTTSTTSTSYTALNSMSVNTTAAGNWAVIFTAQMNCTGDISVVVFSAGVEISSSERSSGGPSGTHNFVMSTSEKITGAALGATVEIRWKSPNGNTATCTGRNLTILKVT